MGKAIFVTGTNTDVGKTYISALITKTLLHAGLRAGYYKAALSGAVPASDGRLLPGDVREVQRLSGLADTQAPMVSYLYENPLSPHLASRIEGNPLQRDRVYKDFQQAKENCDFLTMEGSGGIVCPLRWDAQEKILLADLVAYLQLPVLLVAEAGLGTINATVLTIEYIKSRRLPIKGIILNNFHAGTVMDEDNKEMIEALTAVPVLDVVASDARQLAVDGAFLAALYE